MLFKSEKKKSSAALFMAVGALAVVGACSIFKKGRDVAMRMLPSCVRSTDENN